MKMKLFSCRSWKTILLTLVFLSLQTGVIFAQQIRVVATWPALADITKQIGKELVSVDTLATGVEDPHGVPMKPSFVPRLNRADVLILIGLDDEHAWIPALLEVASNPEILVGRPGYIDCSVGISVLEAPTLVDRSEGDLHPKGNPHYLLDPVRAKIVAQNIATGLSRNFPQHQAEFEKNLKAYSRSWTTGSVAGKNGSAFARRKIRRVPSGMDLSCRSIWHEADRQRGAQAWHRADTESYRAAGAADQAG